MPKLTFRKKVNGDNGNISKFSNEKISVGDIRKTQMITTFGVGSIVDFKDDTVVLLQLMIGIIIQTIIKKSKTEKSLMRTLNLNLWS